MQVRIPQHTMHGFRRAGQSRSCSLPPVLFFFAPVRLLEHFNLPLQFRDPYTKPLFGFSAIPKFVGAGHRLGFPVVAAADEF